MAGEILQRQGCAFDAVEKVGISVENDPEVDTVGYGGFPNMEGEVELDAAFMDGHTLAIGGVAGMKGYRNPISVARRVMTDMPHNLLVGLGAEDFAAKCGFSKSILLTDRTIELWNKRKEAIEKGKCNMDGHDTVGIVAMDMSGMMACGTSTSGISMKHRGRVGDSPLVGSGFYVDNEVGGAAATGVGEDIMKCCTSFYIVELLRLGYEPQKAAEEAVKRTHTRLAKTNGKVGNIAVVCADNMGRFGGAANHEGFGYAVVSDKFTARVYEVQPLVIDR
jgi:Asparaginase